MSSTQYVSPAASEFDMAICAAAADTSLLGPEMLPSAEGIVKIVS